MSEVFPHPAGPVSKMFLPDALASSMNCRVRILKKASEHYVIKTLIHSGKLAFYLLVVKAGLQSLGSLK